MEPAQRLLGRCIRVLREQRGLTQELLAVQAGITYQYLSGVETGKENFTVAVLEGIANALHFPVNALVSAAYNEAGALYAPKVEPGFLRAQVPLPVALTLGQIESAVNATQLTIHRINSHLSGATGKRLQQLIQGNNFSGLVSNILCDSFDACSPYKHNSHQRYPDLINPEANHGKGEGLEVKTTVRIGKGGESHNGHGGWHAVACYEFDKQGDVRFIHIMFARLESHQSDTPDWKYQKSLVKKDTGSQRTETYVTTSVGTTKLRDGTVYLDPSKIDFSRWKQDRSGSPVPAWSIFNAVCRQ